MVVVTPTSRGLSRRQDAPESLRIQPLGRRIDLDHIETRSREHRVNVAES